MIIYSMDYSLAFYESRMRYGQMKRTSYYRFLNLGW